MNAGTSSGETKNALTCGSWNHAGQRSSLGGLELDQGASNGFWHGAPNGRTLQAPPVIRLWRSTMFKKMLVPTDGSDLSMQAAMRAVPLAKLAGAAITTLFVQDVHPYTAVGEVTVGGLQEYVAAVRAEGTRAMQRVVDIARAEGVPTDTLVVENGQTANGIVDAAQATGADLIVMGSHGRSGLAKLVMGSVAAKVLVLSPVSVLVIK